MCQVSLNEMSLTVDTARTDDGGGLASRQGHRGSKNLLSLDNVDFLRAANRAFAGPMF